MQLSVMEGWKEAGNRVMRYGGIRNMAGGNHASHKYSREYIEKIKHLHDEYLTFSDVLEFFDSLEGGLDCHREFVGLLYSPSEYIGRNSDDLIAFHWDGQKTTTFAGYSSDGVEWQHRDTNAMAMRPLVKSLEQKAPVDLEDVDGYVLVVMTKDCDIISMPHRHGLANLRKLSNNDRLKVLDFADVFRNDVFTEAEKKELEKELALEASSAKVSTTGASAPQTERSDKGSEIMSKLANVVSVNKTAAISAARITGGKIAIKNITKLIAPKLPIMVRGYADTSVGQLVIANLFKFAIENYAPQNKNAVLVADAMLEGAMINVLEGFNIEEMIESVLKGVNLESLTAPVDAE